MSIKTILKEIWESFDKPYGKFFPAPEVKKALESKGWKFVPALTYHFPVSTYAVYTPEGELVGGGFGLKHMERYEDAYQKAIETCQKDNKDAQPTPKP